MLSHLRKRNISSSAILIYFKFGKNHGVWSLPAKFIGLCHVVDVIKVATFVGGYVIRHTPYASGSDAAF